MRKGQETGNPMRIFATSLCRPQGILVFLGPYGICCFSPTMIQNKSPLGKITFSVITLSLEPGHCSRKHAESIGNTFRFIPANLKSSLLKAAIIFMPLTFPFPSGPLTRQLKGKSRSLGTCIY